MRLYVILIGLVASMAFFMGYVTLTVKNNLSQIPMGTDEIVQVKKKFEKQVAPIAVLDFKALYYLPGQIKLLNPLYTLTSYTSLNLRGESGSPKCNPSYSSEDAKFFNKKEFMWNEYICGNIARLPYDYFIKEPYVHSSGFSYPYLAYKIGKPIFTNEKWIRNNIPLFHVTELKEISNRIGRLDGYYSVLADFSRRSLIDLLKSETAILSNDKYLVRTYKRTNTHGLVYKVYKRAHLEAFLDSSRYKVVKWSLGEKCSYRDGKVCWLYSPTTLSKFISQFSSLLFYGLLGVLFIIMWMILNKIKSDNRDNENRKMALRVLTHEFRTPVTSLILQMENLTRDPSLFPEEVTNQHLKIKDSVYRLKRLTEMSQKYLRAESKNKSLDFKYQKIDSINAFFKEIVEDFDVEIKFNPLAVDTSFSIEPYWMNICIRNLIENAIKHGKPTIQVELKLISKALEIMVMDEGDSSALNFNRITGAFIKGNQSEGMGLGLNIVSKTIKDMGGKFYLLKGPTRFFIKIKEGKSHE